MRTDKLLFSRSRHEFTRFKGMTAALPALCALEEKCMICFLSIQLVQFFHQWWQFGAPENPENSMANCRWLQRGPMGINEPSHVSSSASLRSTRSVAWHNRTRTNRKKGSSFKLETTVNPWRYEKLKLHSTFVVEIWHHWIAGQILRSLPETTCHWHLLALRFGLVGHGLGAWDGSQLLGFLSLMPVSVSTNTATT